jgi:hypothetical protein
LQTVYTAMKLQNSAYQALHCISKDLYTQLTPEATHSLKLPMQRNTPFSNPNELLR